MKVGEHNHFKQNWIKLEIAGQNWMTGMTCISLKWRQTMKCRSVSGIQREIKGTQHTYTHKANICCWQCLLSWSVRNRINNKKTSFRSTFALKIFFIYIIKKNITLCCLKLSPSGPHWYFRLLHQPDLWSSLHTYRKRYWKTAATAALSLFSLNFVTTLWTCLLLMLCFKSRSNNEIHDISTF